MGGGIQDYLKWTYSEAFEQLSYPGREAGFQQNFPKIQMSAEFPGGDVEASIWRVHYILENGPFLYQNIMGIIEVDEGQMPP